MSSKKFNLEFKFYIFLLAVIIATFFYNISSILSPFIIGIILAYILNPIVEKLESYMDRGFAALLTLLLFIFSFVSILIILGPSLYADLLEFISNCPNYIKKIKLFLDPHILKIYDKVGIEYVVHNEDYLRKISQNLLKLSSKLVGNIWTSSIAAIHVITLAIITPIATFYILRDWSEFRTCFTDIVPKKYLPAFQEIMQSIDRVLSGYLRGQINVCLILGVFYSTSLLIIGLNHSIFVGFCAGILTIIPIFGAIIGLLIATTLAIFQFSGYFPVILVIIIFLIGQFLEGNFITPKLVGSKVGLHPAMVIFALLACGTIAGFIGVLFAIPIFAVIGVLVRYFLIVYKKSSNYE